MKYNRSIHISIDAFSVFIYIFFYHFLISVIMNLDLGPKVSLHSVCGLKR